MADLKTQIVVGANSEGVATGLEAGKRSLKDFAQSATAAGKDAGKGIAAIGQGGDEAARRVDNATKSIIGSIQRTTAMMDAGEKGTAKYYATLGNQRGVNAEVLKPYLDQLKQVEIAQRSAAGTMDKLGLSAVSTSDALARLTGIGLGIGVIVGVVGAVSKGLFEASVAAERLKIGLDFASGGNGVKELGYVTDLSNKLGLSLQSTASSYMSFSAAARGTSLEGAAAKNVFEAVAKASAVMGLTSEQSSGALLALQQMMSKGTVQAEELRGQLGERLPGAFQIAARSMGVTTQQLGKLLETGQVLAADFLPKFAAQLENEIGGGAERAAARLGAATNRMETALFRMKVALGDSGVAEWFASGLNRNTSVINVIATDVEKLNSQAGLRKAAADVNDLHALQTILKNGIESSFYGKGFQPELDAVSAKLEIAKQKFREVNRAAQDAAAGAGGGRGSVNPQTVAQITSRNAAAQAERDTYYAQDIRQTKDQIRTEEIGKARKANAALITKAEGDTNEVLKLQKALRTEIVNIQEKHKDKADKKERIDENALLISSVRDSMAATRAEYELDQKLTPVQKEIATLYEKISNSKKQYSLNTLLAVDALTQEALANEHGNLIREAGRKATEESNKERQKSIDAINKDTASLEDQIRKQQDQNAGIGQTKEAIAALVAQRELDKASTLEAIAIKELDRNLDYQQYDATMAKVAAMRQLAGEQARGGVLQTMEDTAKAAQAEWTKFYDSLYNGLTDSLFRAFEKGGNFFKNFWDGIKNLFKTTVLKLAIQGVVSGATGALGMSAANAATGGSGGGGYLGMASNASSLYSAGSTFTVGSQVLGGTMGIANGIGTIAANATGTGISGLLATNGAYGTAAAGSASAGMGGIMSGLSAIPVWGWVAMAVIAVAAIFGGRGDRKGTGQGIEGNFGSSGFKGNSFATWEQDGGWFHNDSTGKETGSIDGSTTKKLNQAYGAVQMAAASAAVSLGLSADAVVNYSEKISLQLTDDAAANEKAVTKMFGDIGDRMATAVAPGLAALTKDGESAGAALMRLSGSLTTTNAWLDVLGAKLLEVSLAGGDAASKLADTFGGLDKMAAASQSFYETYYSQAERNARSTQDMTNALGQYGLALPANKAAYRDVAMSLDLTTEAGRKAYAVMLTLGPQYAATADAMDALAKEAADKLVATAAAQATAAKDAAGKLFKTFSDAARINFTGLSGALASVDVQTFGETIALVFENLAARITTVIDGISTERSAVAAAALQINAPGVMSRDAIVRGIAATAIGNAPGNAGLVAAQGALGQSDARVAAREAALAQAKAMAPGTAALDAAKAVKPDMDSLNIARASLAAAKDATASAQAQVDMFRGYNNGNFNYFMDAAQQGIDLRGTVPNPSGEVNAQNTVFNLQTAQRNEIPAQAGVAFQQSLYDSAVQKAQATLNAQQAAYSAALAGNAVRVAEAQAKLSAATADQATAVNAARAAQLAYISSLQDFAIDATKSASRLGKLREETMRYYEAQKQLADLMANSASGLRQSVRATRMGQLDGAQSLAQKRGDFAGNYSMALATSGATQAGYADKLASALPDLSAALMDTASTREEWAAATAQLMAQSDTVAALIEANTPKDYAAQSLSMLGQIDAALVVLDTSSKSAEKIIADAINAGSANTVGGLRAVVAALTGKPILEFGNTVPTVATPFDKTPVHAGGNPNFNEATGMWFNPTTGQWQRDNPNPKFAAGGFHAGGLRIVGENGPELENTGPSRIFSANQTRAMLSGDGSGEMVQELRALREEVQGLRTEAQATAGHTSKTARLLDRAMPDGDALATRATV